MISWAEQAAQVKAMNTQEFVDWIQSHDHLITSKTGAVKKAAQMLRVTEMSVWQWLRGNRKTSPSMQLLMELLVEKYESPKKWRRLTRAQQSEIIALLGKKTDREIASQFNIETSAVYRLRLSLGIKCYSRPHGPRVQYDQDFIEALGKMPDSECAQKFGRSSSNVAWIRKKMGIESYQARQSSLKKKVVIDGSAPIDRRKKQYPDQLINLLGKRTDRFLGSKFGYSHQAIAMIRKKRGIQPYRESRKREENQ